MRAGLNSLDVVELIVEPAALEVTVVRVVSSTLFASRKPSPSPVPFTAQPVSVTFRSCERSLTFTLPLATSPDRHHRHDQTDDAHQSHVLASGDEVAKIAPLSTREGRLVESSAVIRNVVLSDSCYLRPE